MRIKNLVVVSLIVTSFLSCQGREREKIMAEIERLDLLRGKAGEFLVEQEMNLFTKRLEYGGWRFGLLGKMSEQKAEIVSAQQSIELYKNTIATIGGSEYYWSEIERLQRSMRNLRPKLAAAQKELSERDPVFLRQIEKMESDLKITQATYDSLNALHTKEVGKLAKFTNE